MKRNVDALKKLTDELEKEFIGDLASASTHGILRESEKFLSLFNYCFKEYDIDSSSLVDLVTRSRLFYDKLRFEREKCLKNLEVVNETKRPLDGADAAAASARKRKKVVVDLSVSSGSSGSSQGASVDRKESDSDDEVEVLENMRKVFIGEQLVYMTEEDYRSYQEEQAVTV